ncbi:MAG TPA: TonB-dependent receptor [Thermoanaerobaculia bacterium]|nr:TonB-dependent receptor [Thermoanaerobaculia bacterium]
MLAFAALLLLLDETIIVTAERLEQTLDESTAAVTVLHHDDLQRLPATNLGDALTLVPGLQLISVNPGAPPMIASRGFFGAGEVEYLQLRIDGVPVGDAESGLADWRSVPIESIDRIEILRGAGSSLFGDTALGGVVQVFRRETSHAAMSAGSFGLLRWNAAYASDAFEIGAHVVQSDGFREHSAYEERFARGAWKRGHMRLTLDASQRDREDPGPLGAEELYRFDHEDSLRMRGAFVYRGETFDVLAHVQDRDSEQVRTLLLAPGFGDRARRDVDTRAYGAAATKTFTIRTGRIASGADATYESIDSAYADAQGSGSRRRAAAFVSGDWTATSTLRFAAGARWDAIADEFAGHDARDRAFSPRIGASLDLGAATAYVQLSRAFKAPTLDQRFDLREIAGEFTISNPELVSQRSKNIELGLRGGGSAFVWEAVGYLTNVDDEIDFDANTFRYANIGRSRHRGIETMLLAHPSGPLAARLTYAWTRVQPLEGEHRGNQLKNIAEHVARLGIDLRTALDVHVEIEHSASRFLDDANQFPLDDATVVDVRVARAIGAFTAALDARNLFDRDYAPLGFALIDVPFFYPAEGRSLAFTLSWHASKGDSR